MGNRTSPPGSRKRLPRYREVGRRPIEQHTHFLARLREAGGELADQGWVVCRLPRAPLGRRPPRRARAAVAQARALSKPERERGADRTPDREGRGPYGATDQRAGIERAAGDRPPAQGAGGGPRSALHDQGRLNIPSHLTPHSLSLSPQGRGELPVANLYIHLPFCKHKCGYCDFNAYAGMDRLMPDYVDALERELAGAREQRAFAALQTGYLRGGTPGLLPADPLTPLPRFIPATFDLAPVPPVT